MPASRIASAAAPAIRLSRSSPSSLPNFVCAQPTMHPLMLASPVLPPGPLIAPSAPFERNDQNAFGIRRLLQHNAPDTPGLAAPAAILASRPTPPSGRRYRSSG